MAEKTFYVTMGQRDFFPIHKSLLEGQVLECSFLVEAAKIVKIIMAGAKNLRE